MLFFRKLFLHHCKSKITFREWKYIKPQMYKPKEQKFHHIHGIDKLIPIALRNGLGKTAHYWCVCMCVFTYMKNIFRPCRWEIKLAIYLFLSSMVLISSTKGNKNFSYSVDISLWYGINKKCDGGHCNGILFSSSRDDCAESISDFALLCHLTYAVICNSWKRSMMFFLPSEILFYEYTLCRIY